jgi:deoxyribodipyrimidine photo-lyase
LDDILLKRVKLLKKGEFPHGATVYWMSRDQRVQDNWALIFASVLAQENRSPLAVVFCLSPNFPDATFRHYAFMVKGLQQVSRRLQERNIPFYLLMGNPEVEVSRFCNQHKVKSLITDFDPVRIKRAWLNNVCTTVHSELYVVDAHNIVPAFLVSDKAEYGAYTIRPKINRFLPGFLNRFPEIPFQKTTGEFEHQHVVWDHVLSAFEVDKTIAEVQWCRPGEEEAQKTLSDFLENKLMQYASGRNNPMDDATSNLSPFLHFGQISAQHVALKVLDYDVHPESAAAFLEELIIRRELSDNFCLFNLHYDTFDGFPAWAKQSLNAQRNDEREFLYTPLQFEKAETHDQLWNAAQREMVVNGKMHGYMRMYWAKKILEWSATPEEALRIAIYLNNRYELDGRDPNGYAGCAWAIGGVHDRAWSRRPVFGMIRYMNSNGCKRKFDTGSYIQKIENT